MKKVTRARVATLEQLGEAEVFRQYVELGSVRKVMESNFSVAEGAMSIRTESFYDWLRAEPGRWERFEQARRDRAHVEADIVSELIDETTPENAGAMRVKISGRQWRAEKLSRADYGNAPATVNVGVGVSIGETWLAALRLIEGKPTP